MLRLIANTCLFFACIFSSTLYANNEVLQTKVEVSVNIFPLKDDTPNKKIADILQQQKIKNSTVYLTHAGKSTLLDIGKNYDQDDGVFAMDIKINNSATKYDIDFQLENKSEDSMPGISSYNVGEDLIFTAKIDGELKLIQVITKTVGANNANQLAKNMLDISKLLFLKDSSQKYFEEDNFWKNDTKRFRRLNKSSLTNAAKFFYLTNSDPDRAIKGIIKLKMPMGLEVNASEFNMGIRNFGLRKGELTFVIQPGKTVLIGRWRKPISITIKEASFLTNEDVDNLKEGSK